MNKQQVLIRFATQEGEGAPLSACTNPLWYSFEEYPHGIRLEIATFFPDGEEVSVYFWGCDGENHYATYEEGVKALLEMGFTLAL